MLLLQLYGTIPLKWRPLDHKICLLCISVFTVWGPNSRHTLYNWDCSLSLVYPYLLLYQIVDTVLAPQQQLLYNCYKAVTPQTLLLYLMLHEQRRQKMKFPVGHYPPCSTSTVGQWLNLFISLFISDYFCLVHLCHSCWFEVLLMVRTPIRLQKVLKVVVVARMHIISACWCWCHSHWKCYPYDSFPCCTL